MPRTLIYLGIAMLCFTSAVLVKGLLNIPILEDIIAIILYCAFLYFLIKPLIDASKGEYYD